MIAVRYLFTLILLLASSGCARAQPSTDAYLLHYFLDIKEESFVAKGSGGEPYYDELRDYKFREKTYLDLLAKSKVKPADPGDIKRLLFLGFAAQSRNDAGMMEALNADLMGVFTANRQTFLSVLKQTPDLQPASCHYLGSYFGFEDQNSGKLQSFLGKNETAMRNALGQEAASACIGTMSQVAR